MKQKGLEKAHELTDAKISFVSLVDRAANKRSFLITKNDDGQASFTSYGRILKADPETHYVTGVVYEPLTEDTQGDYMTEEEITKAAYWFVKNGDMVDLQHSFDPLPGVAVVESWVEKADIEIEGEPVKKGTWLMTVEVTDDEIWDGIQKGDITGFSMGGQATWNEEDIDLSTVEKTNEGSEKKGLLKMLAEALGLKTVEKGEVTEIYEEETQCDMFWNAFDALERALKHWDPMTDEPEYETDIDKITEALGEFNEIITGILTAETPVIKQVMEARPAEKAAEPMSEENQQTLQGIYESLGTIVKSFEKSDSGDEPDKTDPDVNKNLKKEDTDMTRAEVEGMVQEAVDKAVSTLSEQAAEQTEQAPEAVTAESIQQMVDDAVAKAAQPQEEQLTPDQVQEMVTKAVDAAMQPILASRGLPSSLNDTVEKAANQKPQHYLHGIL